MFLSDMAIDYPFLYPWTHSISHLFTPFVLQYTASSRTFLHRIFLAFHKLIKSIEPRIPIRQYQGISEINLECLGHLSIYSLFAYTLLRMTWTSWTSSRMQDRTLSSIPRPFGFLLTEYPSCYSTSEADMGMKNFRQGPPEWIGICTGTLHKSYTIWAGSEWVPPERSVFAGIV